MTHLFSLIVGVGLLAAPAPTPRPNEPGLVPASAGLECLGQTVTIAGTAGDDELSGTEDKDVIHGFAGDDVIHALGGDDVVCGGDGIDEIWLDSGEDTAYGGDGGDTIHGGSEVDSIHGEQGPDTIFGEGAGDQLYGEEGKDHLYGGGKPVEGLLTKHAFDPAQDGDDRIFGGDGDDELFGGPGDDLLSGGAGDDHLAGESGQDVLSCGGDSGDQGDGGTEHDTFSHDFDDCASDTSVGGPEGFRIAKEPLGADQEFTSNDERTFLVAGCVPQGGNRPAGNRGFLSGSNWTACNDLDFVRDKVEQSDFVSCLELFPNGVLNGIFLSEVRNRRWKFFRFRCRDLQPDGTLGDAPGKPPMLFSFDGKGTQFETVIPETQLAVGVFEVWNMVQLVSKQNLLQIGIVHQNAAAIFEAGQRGKHAQDLKVTDRVPKASPLTSKSTSWLCPAGMVLTGAAIGHIPENNEKSTRPVYILGECRRLLKD